MPAKETHETLRVFLPNLPVFHFCLRPGCHSHPSGDLYSPSPNPHPVPYRLANSHRHPAPPAFLSPRQALSQFLGIEEAEIQLQSLESVTRSDSCLALASPEELCAQQLTPGYRITLLARSATYTYHSDQTGEILRLEEPKPSAPLLISLQPTSAQACQSLKIYANGSYIVTGCAAPAVQGRLLESQLERLIQLATTYAAFDHQSIQFFGAGAQTPMTYEKENILQFANQQFDIYYYTSLPNSPHDPALQALTAYLQALPSQDYSTAAQQYGGKLTKFQLQDPDFTSKALPAWLQNACDQNICLQPRSLFHTGADEQGNLLFLVEFNNPDGTLYHRTLEGETSASFTFTLQEQETGWRVLELPPYLP